MDTHWISDLVAIWDVVVSGPVEAILPETVFRFSSERGEGFVLKKVGGIDDSRPDRLEFERELLLHVCTAGLPVAVPLRDRRGRIAVPWGRPRG